MFAGRLFLAFLFIMLTNYFVYSQPTLSDPELGIARDLAKDRASRYSDLHYHFRIHLVPGQEQLEATTTIRVKVATPLIPMILDFKGTGEQTSTINGSLSKIVVNDQIINNYHQVNGHIIIPTEALKTGENTIQIAHLSPARKAGVAITRYIDTEDQSEYLYTLFVPSDAHMVLPCFDQPDLKAQFTLEVIAPTEWTVITNTNIAERLADAPSGKQHLIFQETKPLSTYLFAFAAGPFMELPVAEKPVKMHLFARKSKIERARAELAEVGRLNREGIQALADYFDSPYPFEKYDLVVLPEFAYGGMEHAGATFLREDRVLFPNEPTPNDLLARAELILHEAAHQWFGDLVTMRWFDDLWLKEGFATFMAYHAMEKVYPGHVWQNFYLNNKPRAYSTDCTKGTTPIFQEIANLKDAKSAYGNIVYTKAPSMLRQLEFYLGTEPFKLAVQLFLKDHAYHNAEWLDLIKSCESTSKINLTAWAQAWVKERGMAIIEPEEQIQNGQISTLILKQHNILGEPTLWPLKTKILLGYKDRAPKIFTVNISGSSTTVVEAKGQPQPDYIFTNYEDFGYGQFRLNSESLKIVPTLLANISDDFLRILLWGALWDAVQESLLAPKAYLEIVSQRLPHETDSIVIQLILNNATTAFSRYLSKAQQDEIAPKLEALIFKRMKEDNDKGTRLTCFRVSLNITTTMEGRQQLKDMLTGRVTIPQVALKAKDRWDIITTLLAQEDNEATTLWQDEQKRDQSDDAHRLAFIANAAQRASKSKAAYFDRYLNDRELAESWIQNSLRAFNSISHHQETLPYLKPALAALPILKKQRKIFFINEWLSAFIGGQYDAEALKVVQDYLQQQTLERDLQLKILESLDRLERCVNIRTKYAQTKE